MSGAVPVLYIHAFMVWTGTTLFFYECKREKYMDAIFQYYFSFLALPFSVMFYVYFMQFFLCCCVSGVYCILSA